jgi:hypothetical protein
VTVNSNGKYECDILCIGLCGAGAAFIKALTNHFDATKIASLKQETV